MTDRARFFDSIAGLAGNALSMATGLREEVEQLVRTQVDEALRRLKLVRIEELEAVQELAANARSAQDRAESRLLALEARLAVLETKRGTENG